MRVRVYYIYECNMKYNVNTVIKPVNAESLETCQTFRFKQISVASSAILYYYLHSDSEIFPFKAGLFCRQVPLWHFTCILKSVTTFSFSAPNPNVDSWNLNLTLCGRQENLNLSSTNNIMKLDLSTDRWFSFQGFKGIARSGNIFIMWIKPYLQYNASSNFIRKLIFILFLWQNVEVKFSGTVASLEALPFIPICKMRADSGRSSANGLLQWRREEPYSWLLKTST